MVAGKISYKKFTLILIIISALVITYLHYSTVSHFQDLHNVFAELYYIPILLGALVFGLKGAMITYVAITIIYAPYVYINWVNTFSFAANKLSHAVFSGSIAFLAGFFVEQEKKRRRQYEKDHYLASLGRAAAAIVHDLKTPLVTIGGFAKRIYEEKGNIREESEIILNSANKMQLIVNDVLDFSKPVKLDFQQEDVNQIISHVCESCKPKADEKEVDISLSLPDDKRSIPMDRMKLERALVNLINNAIDASVIGAKVSISVKSDIEHYSIIIKDYGVGMDKETIDNLFIPFFTKKSSGTGIGLAIAKKIIEGHQGNITIKSREQVGTKVIVELPCEGS